jgi:integrase
LSDLDLTFGQQAELWLRDLASRKRRPVAPSTLRVFGSYVRRLTPIIGKIKLADINNGVLRNLVHQLEAEKLSAKTINELIATVKQVVGSLVDQDGNRVHKREWNHTFIDLPDISNQKQPCLSAKDVERCIRDAASDQERALYCVLAGSGLRIAEALAIHVNGREDQTSWSPQDQAIRVRSSVFGGREILRLKTAAAKRTVDVDPVVSDLINRFIELQGILPGDYLFQARSGRAIHLKTTRERRAKHGIPGFHSFRRYRITQLREFGVPEDIVRFWAGHEGQSITDRYSKLSENVEVRREWARRPGLLGFDLPALSKQRRPSSDSRESAQPEAFVEERARYVASDDDLDPFFAIPVTVHEKV